MTTQNNQTLDNLKKDIEKYIINLLNEKDFQDYGFIAYREIEDLQLSIYDLVDKYTSDIKSSVFCNDTIKEIINHNIYRECLEELKRVIGKNFPHGETKVKNGSWVFTKKSWTPKSVAKKITKKVFFRSPYDQDRYSGIRIPTFFNESTDKYGHTIYD